MTENETLRRYFSKQLGCGADTAYPAQFDSAYCTPAIALSSANEKHATMRMIRTCYMDTAKPDT